MTFFRIFILCFLLITPLFSEGENELSVLRWGNIFWFDLQAVNCVILIKAPVIWTPKRSRNRSTATSGWAGPLWWASLASALTALCSQYFGERGSPSTPQSTLWFGMLSKGCPQKKRNFQTIVQRVGRGNPQTHKNNYKLILDKSRRSEGANSLCLN